MNKTVVGTVIAVLVIVGVVGAVVISKHNKTETPATTQPSPSPSTTNPTSETPSPSPSTDTQNGNAVTIQDFAFSPATLTVKKGTAVTWTNKDSTAHTVTVNSGDGPKSQNIAQNATFSYTFNTAGTFAYHCDIHPNMTATVTVTE